MADLKRDDIIKLAQLARLDLSEDEIVEYSKELSAILGYVEKLQSINTDNLTPTNQVTGLTNVTRKDEIVSYGYEPQTLLKNVPTTSGDLIKVKRILG